MSACFVRLLMRRSIAAVLLCGAALLGLLPVHAWGQAAPASARVTTVVAMAAVEGPSRHPVSPTDRSRAGHATATAAALAKAEEDPGVDFGALALALLAFALWFGLRGRRPD